MGPRICCIYDLAFKPDGSEILVAADNKVIIYDGIDGTLLQTLKGHKELVYTVDWSHDGETFASGSADKSVILWTEQHEGTLKFTHSDAVQRIAFSPVSPILLSCAISDFGIWSTTDKNVVKQRVESRCCCCAWNNDGTLFAIGHADGTVTIRKCSNITDDSFTKMDRTGEPVWSVAFSSYPDMTVIRNTDDTAASEILAVADWSKNLAFYTLDGTKVEKEYNLDFEPHCMEYFNNGQFLLVGGSNKQLMMYTRFGVPLGVVAIMDTWIWSVRSKPNSTSVVIGCVDGTIACYNLMFSTVHGLYHERYAFRENMTEIVIQNLLEHTSTRIRCHDHVKKLSLYGQKLAVQLSDKLVIYRQTSGENEPLEYKICDKIMKVFECQLLVVSANHIILCQDETLICYDQKGLKQREWVLDSQIRYIKVVGGPPGRETLVAGLKDGQIYKIFVDNPFPIEILRLSSAIRSVDLNCSRTLAACVDDNQVCSVYDLKTKECQFQEPNCNSVAFNTLNENVFCYTTNATLTVRALHYPGHTQKMMGYVVGFAGNKVFCLHMYHLNAFEVPFSIQVYQYVENKRFKDAFRLACLGVIEDDWNFLGRSALINGDLEIAAKAFTRTREYRMLQLIREIQELLKNGEPETVIQCHIMAYDGKFREAAQMLRENGFENKAMELFTDLRMFEDAQEVMVTASGETKKMLMRKRAVWAKDSNQPKVAAEMLISSGDLDKAAQLIIDNDWLELAIDISRKLDRTDIDTVRKLATYFVRKHEYGLASKIYSSVNDTKSIVEMHVNAGHWTDAFAIADRYPKYVEDVYLPYARHLAERDQFEEAQKAFHMAGKEQEALYVLEQLTNNAVHENRFADAGYHYWLLSQQYLERSRDNHELIAKYSQAAIFADIYYAYDQVFLYCNQPFSFERPENILNMARFLAFQPSAECISHVFIYYTIARIGAECGAYKSARQALEQLTHLRIPRYLDYQIDVMTLNIRAKPFSDDELMQPMCYRCGLNNPFLGGMVCIHCQTPFIISFATFDVLPLVEFQIESDISHDEAMQLINAEPPLSESEYNPIRIAQQQKKNGTKAIVLNRDELSRLEQGQVIVLNYPPPLTPKYIFNTMPTITISQCKSCCKLFDLDDFEMAVLQKGHCPFCRTSQERSDNYILDDEENEERNDTVPNFGQFANFVR
ncbi:unnamed protein product [Caenorhabditis bovis]|uniref:Intraflagellar transport protein 122 homolog n=1 Tax=Caenorhabditis bovis TaxID=2654633 RepID=A0A8S1EX66_9PELO|nr:unnamed protein product [Caenorhabditis bovis]